MRGPLYEGGGVRLFCGDARDVLALLPAESVQTCVTSPPYWGLRDYGTARWEGGDPTCNHRSPTMREGRNEDRPTLAGSAATNQAQLLLAHRTGCGKCGAVKVDAQLGLEATPDAYVAAMVAVFREVRRVLREDGTLWLNLGDSYCADVRKGRAHMGIGKNDAHNVWFNRQPDGLKHKDLVGIPWRVAFALQADGWYLRSDVIWHKPNPMPESVTDRPTKAHEYLFLLSKSATYYYDAEAVAEPALKGAAGSTFHEGKTGVNGLGRVSLAPRVEDFRRNRRSVWTIPTQPYPEAHFAVFPPDLIKPCVLAGSKPGDVVLDPFAGSGTTLYVAKEFGRQALGVELNPAYCALAARRLRQEVLFAAPLAERP